MTKNFYKWRQRLISLNRDLFNRINRDSRKGRKECGLDNFFITEMWERYNEDDFQETVVFDITTNESITFLQVQDRKFSKKIKKKLDKINKPI